MTSPIPEASRQDICSHLPLLISVLSVYVRSFKSEAQLVQMIIAFFDPSSIVLAKDLLCWDHFLVLVKGRRPSLWGVYCASWPFACLRSHNGLSRLFQRTPVTFAFRALSSQVLTATALPLRLRLVQSSLCKL